jgi:uncharacterized protein YecA (UPF0149 family)
MFFDNATNITLSGNRAGPCPRCGGMGHVPDGVFNFVGSTIEILSAPERTIDELQRFASILREAQKTSQTKEEVAAKVERDVPALSGLIKLLPENRAELYGFLAVVLAAIQLLTQPSESSKANSPQVTVNVTQVIEQAVAPQSKPAAQARPEPSRKVGRNEPCPCGSGEKYKKCHGALR